MIRAGVVAALFARQGAPAPEAVAPEPVSLAAAPSEQARIVASYPHDTAAFTQGLLIDRGQLYESTGRGSAGAASDIADRDRALARPGRASIRTAPVQQPSYEGARNW